MATDRIAEALDRLYATIETIFASPEARTHVLGNSSTLHGLAFIIGTAEVYRRFGRGGAFVFDEPQALAEIDKVRNQLEDALTTLQLGTMPNRASA